ncbi:MAG TPA: type II toxin-antitoxin system HicA family toxin [Longimicrobium sp.]|nr:type II toxin-antitoxin system HicA family toxin [Longimicrobium sp.]
MKPLSGKELGSLLEARGWELARVHGSHHVYRKSGHMERISVPVHGNKPLKPGLQRHLMKIAGILPEDL